METSWLLLVLAFCLSVRCSGQTYDGFGYSVSGTNITITSYTGPGGAVTIPPSIPGVDGTVTSVGADAFEECGGLTSVTIPGTVTDIGADAFYYCGGLTSVTIPGSVTSIGENAFAGCYGLTSVTIPSSVTAIETAAFWSCAGLTNVTIPNSVTSIGGAAFQLCRSLRGVTIPSSVTSIGDGAFDGCNGLTSVTIPSSVTDLGDLPFGWCSGLNAFTVETQNPSYSSLGGVLFNKNQTTLLAWPPGKAGAYSIPNSVTNVGGWAFGYCSGLTGVTIPGSVTDIGDYAFYDCSGLTGAYFQGSPPSGFGLGAFNNTAPQFSIYYPSAAGWTSPTWRGYPAQPVYLAITTQPFTQTAELGKWASFFVEATNAPPEATAYQWCFGGTSTLTNATNSFLVLPVFQPGQAGAYLVVVTNLYGAVTSDAALLSVIPAVTRSTVPAVGLSSGTGSLLPLEYVDQLPSAPSLWSPLTNVALNGAPPLCFDLSQPLPAQRFYRAWQTTGPQPTLDMRLATEIPLAGAIGSSVEIDYINVYGPTNAWVTLDTVTLTNSPQLYFDVTAFRQPQRLYRLVPSP